MFCALVWSCHGFIIFLLPCSFVVALQNLIMHLLSPGLVFRVYIFGLLDFGTHLFPNFLIIACTLFSTPAVITELPTIITLSTSTCILSPLTAIYSSYSMKHETFDLDSYFSSSSSQDLSSATNSWLVFLHFLLGP